MRAGRQGKRASEGGRAAVGRPALVPDLQPPAPTHTHPPTHPKPTRPPPHNPPPLPSAPGSQRSATTPACCCPWPQAASCSGCRCSSPAPRHSQQGLPHVGGGGSSGRSAPAGGQTRRQLTCSARAPPPVHLSPPCLPDLAIKLLAMVTLWPVPSVMLVAVPPECLSTVAARTQKRRCGDVSRRQPHTLVPQGCTHRLQPGTHSWGRGSPSGGGPVPP